MKKYILTLILILILCVSNVDMADNWVSPTGFVDSDSQWYDETNIYDDNTGTYGRENISSDSWSSWIELTIGSLNCDKIRFYADYSSALNSIQVDVYYSEGWHNIKDGSFTDKDWEEVSLGGTYTVTAARVRIYCNGTGQNCYLYEFAFNEVATETGANTMFMFSDF